MSSPVLFADAFFFYFYFFLFTPSVRVIDCIAFPARPLYFICLPFRLIEGGGGAQIWTADSRNVLALWLISPPSDTVNSPVNEGGKTYKGL